MIEDWQLADLRRPSVVRTGRLPVLEHRLLGPILGDLTPRDISALDGSLRSVLGLP